MRLEEKKARESDGQSDSVEFQAAIANIKKLLGKALEMKKSQANGSEMNDVRVQALIHVMTLKRLNRIDKLRTRAHRDATNEAKARVDGLDLKLQNLLYEVQHLRKEIAKCQQYKSGDEDIELISVEDFYSEAPADISRKSETAQNPHKQRLARLKFEDKQRFDMHEEWKALESNREQLQKTIREKSEKLSSLDPQLKTLLKHSKPIEDYLGMSITEEKNKLELMRYLPLPMFVLVKQTDSYGKACDEDIKVSILGTAEAARAHRSKKRQEQLEDSIDNGNADDEETESRKKKKKGRTSSAASTRGKLDELLSTHPLKVVLRVRSGDNFVDVTFSYLETLATIAVEVQVNLDEETKSSLGVDTSVTQPDKFLSHLLDAEDSGQFSPNPTFLHHMSRLGLKIIPDKEKVEVGRLYVWANNLGGLEFAPPKPINDDADEEGDTFVEYGEVDENVSATRVGNIIKAIRERLNSRVALQKHIGQLEKIKVLPIALEVPDAMRAQFPTSQPKSCLRNWGAIEWTQYRALEVTHHLVESGIVSGDDFFYRLQVNRDPASLIALIAVKPDYPKSTPYFCLNLHWRGEHNSTNSEHVRRLEREVNAESERIPKECRSILLTVQLLRLLTNFDVTLEAWNAAEPGDSLDFPREKAFIHPIRGRDRSLPIHYSVNQNMFSQR